jgi:hypothetical protein
VEEPAHNNVNILLVLEKWQDKEAWQFLHKFSNACLLSSQSHFSIMSTEKPGQRLNIYLHHYKKIAALQEGTVDHKSMEVKMPAGIIPECLNGNYDSRYTGFLAKGYLYKSVRGHGCPRDNVDIANIFSSVFDLTIL